MELIFVAIPLQLLSLYTLLYVILWVSTSMLGYPRPKFLFWRNRSKKISNPVDDFRIATQRLLDAGWYPRDIATLLKQVLTEKFKNE